VPSGAYRLGAGATSRGTPGASAASARRGCGDAGGGSRRNQTTKTGAGDGTPAGARTAAGTVGGPARGGPRQRRPTRAGRNDVEFNVMVRRRLQSWSRLCGGNHIATRLLPLAVYTAGACMQNTTTTTVAVTDNHYVSTVTAARGRIAAAPCELRIGNESVPIQLAQCWFPGLAISNAKI